MVLNLKALELCIITMFDIASAANVNLLISGGKRGPFVYESLVHCEPSEIMAIEGRNQNGEHVHICQIHGEDMVDFTVVGSVIHGFDSIDGKPISFYIDERYEDQLIIEKLAMFLEIMSMNEFPSYWEYKKIHEALVPPPK